jgi:undecaprenyl-diphosphatase
MTIQQSVILGIVQGITEFLPISSSGHLVILQHLFGIKEPQVTFDIFLHLGTLISILIYFRKEIIGMFTWRSRTILYVVVASIPTFIIGFTLKDAVEELFARPHVVGYMLLATGILLISATFYSRRRGMTNSKNIGFVNSIIVGAAQGIAVMPGISRSGATIASGILSGVGKDVAFKFSFLLAIPTILGASLLKCGQIGFAFTSGELLSFLSGGAVAMVTGLAAINLLAKIIRANALYIFGIYCILAALSIIVLL